MGTSMIQVRDLPPLWCLPARWSLFFLGLGGGHALRPQNVRYMGDMVKIIKHVKHNVAEGVMFLALNKDGKFR